MKKNIFLLILILLSVTISSQEKDGTSVGAGRNTTFIDNGFWDNWFIG